MLVDGLQQSQLHLVTQILVHLEDAVGLNAGIELGDRNPHIVIHTYTEDCHARRCRVIVTLEYN